MFISYPLLTPQASPIHSTINQSIMALSFSTFFRFRITTPWPVILFAATWTMLLTFTVAVASFSPEAAFVMAISPSSSFSNTCNTQSFIRLPLDVPADILCFPPQIFAKSKIDLIVPPVFAAVIVAASACLVRAVGLWEHDYTQNP